MNIYGIEFCVAFLFFSIYLSTPDEGLLLCIGFTFFSALDLYFAKLF